MLQRLGPWRYRAEDRLGGGGMAQTYRCTHPGLAGEFAIKVLKNPGHVNTLLREVRALIALDGCPGIPSLVDHGRGADGQLCMVSTLMPGIRLDQQVRRQGPIAADAALGIVQQLLRILQHAHGRGVLHKDIKHSNILIQNTQVSLIDWGTSEFTHESPQEALRAKLSYVAPECYFGAHGPAVDFYALGWLAIYLVTGQEPYHCASLKDKHYWALAHLFERRDWPGMPAPITTLARHWLARRPEARSLAYDIASLDGMPLPADTEEGLLDFSAISGQDYVLLGARRGVPYFQCELARRLQEDGQQAAAIGWLEAAAAQGYARALRLLARALPEQPEHALRKQQLLHASASSGSAAASYMLAKALIRQGDANGSGAEAYQLLVGAASQGHAGALERLARQLPALSARLALELAAESGHPGAAKALQTLSSGAG